MNEGVRKRRIILTHTGRIGTDYLKSLDFRNNGKYDKKPHYVILKTGEIVKILDEYETSNIFHLPKLNQTSIVVSLENLGWLKKDILSTTYSNWIGNKVEKIKEKKWRSKSFWDLYSDEQTESLIKLCDEICDKHNIPKKFSGNNVRIIGAEDYEGIICRSNLDEIFTDLSPAFNFVYLLDKYNYDERI